MLNPSIISASNFDNIGKLLESFLDQWWSPLLIALAAASGILGAVAGIKYILAAQSGDEQKLKQAKTFLISIVIGIVVVFLLAGGIPVIIASFQTWFDNDAQEYTAILGNLI